MGAIDFVVIALIILFTIVLALLGRLVREPLMELESPLPADKAFETLRDSMTRRGWSILSLDEKERSLVIGAKIKVVNLVLYWTWADRITISIKAAPNSTGSLVVASCRLAPVMFYVKKSDPLYLEGHHLREMLAEPLQARVVKKSCFI